MTVPPAPELELAPEPPGTHDAESTDPGSETSLAEHHRKTLIDGSGISEDVVRARGYFTATRKEELEEVGFGKSQRIVPTLVIPIHDVHGEIALHVHRPDRPRTLHGKSRKYEFPAKTPMVIDVPPGARAALGDPRVPLLITEGSKKADSAVSRGLCCIALLGVWNWRGTNEQGGKTELPDWEAIALNDREVFVAFDSDVTTKPQVRAALKRLRALLESRGADVKIVLLQPSGDGGAKTGLDDYFAAGGDAESLEDFVLDDLPPPPPVEREPSCYVIRNGGFSLQRRVGDTIEYIPLSNFTGKIIHEGVVDDGVEQSLHFDVQIVRGNETRELRVRADAFDKMEWVAQLGAQAIVEAGSNARNHLAVAIRKASSPARSRVFAHVGWREVEGEWMFLHAHGAIGAEGARDDIEVCPPETLRQLVLPESTNATQLRSDVRQVIDALLGLGPDGVVFPLLGAAFRAPFGDSDFSLFMAGPSGAFKSQLAYLTQSFFGAGFARGPAPCSWHSTANAISELAFAAKDSVLLVDDFVARGGHERDSLMAAADRVFRGAGNRTGRQRLTQTGEARPERPPRTLLLSTGEDYPEGYSLVARLFVVQLRHGDVTAEALTRAQDTASGGAFARVMSGFLAYLARNYTEHVASFRELVRARRDGLKNASHRRIASAAADLIEGTRAFADFALVNEAIDSGEAEQLGARAKTAITANLVEQATTLQESEPVAAFLNLLRSVLSTGAGHVVDHATGCCPDGPLIPSRLGWRREPGAWAAGGPAIGWVRLSGDRPALYLDMHATMAVIGKLVCAAGDRPMIGEKALRQRLAESGVIEVEVERCGETARRRLEPKRTVVGTSRRVTDLELTAVWPSADEQEDS